MCFKIPIRLQQFGHTPDFGHARLGETDSAGIEHFLKLKGRAGVFARRDRNANVIMLL
jgi:hypothetical protein